MKVSASMAASTSASVIDAIGLVWPVTTAIGTSTSGAGVGVGTGVGEGDAVGVAVGPSADPLGSGSLLRQAESRTATPSRASERRGRGDIEPDGTEAHVIAYEALAAGQR